MDRDEPHREPVSRIEQVPQIGASITVNLGGDRQMVLQSFIDRDADATLQSAFLNRMCRLADKQKARYDLEKHEEEFETVGRALTNFLDAIPFAETNHKRKMAALKVELDAKVEARDEVYKQGYQAFRSDGRLGTYEPKGALKASLARMDVDIEKVKAALEAGPHDLEQERQNALKSIRHYQDDLKKRRVKLNELRALAEREPMADFLEQESADPEMKG